MTPDEMKLDMLVAELDYENRLLRARNERLTIENESRSALIEEIELVKKRNDRLTAENECMANQIKELQACLAPIQASGEH